jgi:hypothetical protein
MPESSALLHALEDPMFARFDMPLRRMYYPLGFPLEVHTNSRDVIAAASETWGFCSQSFDTPPMRLSLGVVQGASEELPLPPKSNFVAREHMIAIVANAWNFAVCDFDRAFSFGFVTPALASDYATLRYRFLTPVAVMMAEYRALAPLHGALVAHNGRGIVLCGDSFAGKSTLAYACARTGWTYVSDDGTFLVRDRLDCYAVGDCHIIRFREEARQLFPELADRVLITRPNGKIGLEVFTRDLPVTIAAGSKIDHVVFLNRQHTGTVRLRPFPKDQLEAWCERYVKYGTEEVQDAQRRCHRWLLHMPAWELSYEDLDDAIRRLEELADSGV